MIQHELSAVSIPGNRRSFISDNLAMKNWSPIKTEQWRCIIDFCIIGSCTGTWSPKDFNTDNT